MADVLLGMVRKLNRDETRGIIMNILITGATGFIGSALIEEFNKKNHKITILTRNKKYLAKKKLAVFESLDDVSDDSIFHTIINLAGAPISKRWSTSYKNELIESRIKITGSINALVKRLHKKPKTIISASAVGYYGHQGSVIINEESNPHDEFTHKLCRMWEEEALRSKKLGVNVTIIRLGVVLGIDGGILKETVPIFKMGLGGKIGSGKQYISWVHIDDVIAAINFLLQSNTEGGVYNLTAPFPVTNAQWTQLLSRALARPALLPLPGILVKLLFGEMGEALLLRGQKVVPKRLEKAEFKFQYPTLEDAFSHIF